MARKRPEICQKVLLVEGNTECFVIPELIESYGVQWLNHEVGVKVPHIEDCNGYENLNKKKTITTALKGRGLTHLGIIIDADEDPENRWLSIKNTCQDAGIFNLPNKLPENGLIEKIFVESISKEINFGIWIMPDNKLRGMLETFLVYLVPNDNELLWEYAKEVAQEARNKGATFTDTQTDKANIYTWLAWQNKPGRQLHQAIKEKILHPSHPQSNLFFNWFQALFIV